MSVQVLPYPILGGGYSNFHNKHRHITRGSRHQIFRVQVPARSLIGICSRQKAVVFVMRVLDP